MTPLAKKHTKWKEVHNAESIDLLSEAIRVCIRQYHKTKDYGYLKTAQEMNAKIKEIVNRNPEEEIQKIYE